MTAPFFPAGAAEFPNDNPSLHDGARWVCPDTIGESRAIVRARASGGAIPVVAADLAPLLERAAAEPARQRRYEGPLDLDLGRILLVHRVENIPPPPDFIFTPFVSSRRCVATTMDVDTSRVCSSGAVSDVASTEVPLSEAVVAALAADPTAGGVCAALVPAPIEPRPCRAVDEREACRRVDRGWRVDVAPCLNVGASSEALRARVRRRAISTARALPSSASPSSSMPPGAPELEAASA